MKDIFLIEIQASACKAQLGLMALEAEAKEYDADWRPNGGKVLRDGGGKFASKGQSSGQSPAAPSDASSESKEESKGAESRLDRIKKMAQGALNSVKSIFQKKAASPSEAGDLKQPEKERLQVSTMVRQAATTYFSQVKEGVDSLDEAAMKELDELVRDSRDIDAAVKIIREQSGMDTQTLKGFDETIEMFNETKEKGAKALVEKCAELVDIRKASSGDIDSAVQQGNQIQAKGVLVGQVVAASVVTADIALQVSRRAAERILDSAEKHLRF